MPEYRDPKNRRERYEKLRAALWTERQSGFDPHWRELGDFFMPRRTRFFAADRNRADKRNQNIIDSTGRFSARTLSSGLHAGLTSPARPWMNLTTPDPALAAFGPVKLWLHDVTMRMLTVFATTNLYNVLPLVYLDMGIFGTSAMAMIGDSRDLFRCYSYPIGSYALGQDARGQVTTFVRDYELTVRQVVEEFGLKENGRDIDWSNISDAVKNQWDRGDYETRVEVTWLVKPNELYDRTKLASKYLKWASCHFETASRNRSGEQEKFLRESGFNTFPIQAPRWDITGEDSYGTDSPGMTALGDVKQLQIMQRKKGQLLSKAVDPPLKGPAALRTQKTSLLPGDITYVDVREGMQGLSPIHEIRLEGYQHISQDMGEVQYRIQRAFYEDLFLMLARSDDRMGSARPTAREVDERHEEKLLALGPVLERTNDELLDPIVDRAYQLMEEAGLIPPAPTQLHGVKLKVEYISILAQAQKLVGVASQDRLMTSVVNLLPMFPEMHAKINTDQVIDDYGEMLGTDPRLIRSNDEAAAIRDQQRKAQEAQAQADQAAQMGKALRDASQAPLTGDTALNAIVQSAGRSMAPGMVQ